MHELFLAGKVICLFVSITFGFVNIAKIIYKQDISNANNFLMSAGITGFITLQWLI